jgi:FkbM family methyltransferase
MSSPQKGVPGMQIFERIALRIRHHPSLDQAHGLWDQIRPLYIVALRLLNRRGIPRRINGTDALILDHQLHGHPEVYEPEVWQRIMHSVREGDVVADVGASIGLYTVAIAKRIGVTGRVFAFEPDPQSFAYLHRHVEQNSVQARVRLFPCAVGAADSSVDMLLGSGSTSHVVADESKSSPAAQVKKVQLRCVDSVFADTHLNVLKIDVEGYEFEVLKGARNLLADPERAPRMMFIELHPYRWQELMVNDAMILSFLRQHGYQVYGLDRQPVTSIHHYGQVVCERQ